MKNPSKLAFVIPSAVSVIRVFFAILLVTWVVERQFGTLVIALIGVPLVFSLDAVDGILARRYKSQTLLGSFIDIAADRLVEFVFLQYFIVISLIPLWFVIIFYGRIILTDACRMYAFQIKRMSETGISLPQPLGFLVLSKLSRSGYGALKAILFSVLFLAVYRGHTSLSFFEIILLLSVLAFSLLRATPILITYLPIIFSAPSEETSISQSLAQDMPTRTTKIASWMQLVSDICLALVLAFLALR